MLIRASSSTPPPTGCPLPLAPVAPSPPLPPLGAHRLHRARPQALLEPPPLRTNPRPGGSERERRLAIELLKPTSLIAQLRACDQAAASVAMAGKASVALFLAVNMVVFAMASACGGNCPPSTPSTPSSPTPTPASFGKCPRDALKLGVCANVLNLIKAKVGVPPTEPCCPLLEGLVDLEAAVCLCTAIKGSILGINLNLPIDLSLILNHCGKTVPTGFMCL
ncbi:hypothetical protein HU200_042473 [Digitaria exilis]|uniref:Bifunctional inhibitor/plant lipid transfer protein/seed storage helical domain-containing protein n=1 Tax=Digitaria exilis TaxID=1010633 RepID=A0A835B5Y4_9POAL|nr:hypothetical protein HU200_042473 [Digitaria exilis]